MMHYGSVPFDVSTRRLGFPATEDGYLLHSNVTHAKSRGTVRLTSLDFRDQFKMRPRYSIDELGHEMTVTISGIRRARKVVSQPATSAWARTELHPAKMFDVMKRSPTTATAC